MGKLLVAGMFSLVSFQVVAGEQPRIVNEGGIKDQWTLAEGATLAAPGYPAQFVERGDSVCLALGYAIKPDGSTSDFSVVKSWSSGGKQPDAYWDAFAQASAGAVSQWKFAPRPEVNKAQATYTVATMQFMGKPAMDGAELRGHCRIDDLAAVVEKNRRNNPTNSQVRRDIERAERNRSALGNTPPVRPRPASGG
jgi:hypothetical protein